MADCKKGVFLSLDVVVAMMLIFSAILISFSLFTAPSNADPGGQLVDTYLQDAATLASNTGSLDAPLLSANNSNTSAISQVLRATPDSVCMQVAAFCTEVPQGLQAYWKLDEDFGPAAADSSGNAHSGAIVDGLQSEENGRSGRAMRFNGSNYVDTDFDSSWNDNNSVSWSFWVKPDESGDYEGMIGKEYDDWEWVFYRNGNNAGLYYFDQSGGDSNGMNGEWGESLSFGEWTHLAYVWDGYSSYFYTNGVLINTVSAGNPSTNQDGGGSVIIGGRTNYKGEQLSFHGEIDEVRAYGRALSAEEIRKIYSNPTNVAYSLGKSDCPYSGGQVRAVTLPVLKNADQNENNYCYAIMKAW